MAAVRHTPPRMQRAYEDGTHSWQLFVGNRSVCQEGDNHVFLQLSAILFPSRSVSISCFQNQPINPFAPHLIPATYSSSIESHRMALPLMMISHGKESWVQPRTIAEDAPRSPIKRVASKTSHIDLTQQRKDLIQQHQDNHHGRSNQPCSQQSRACKAVRTTQNIRSTAGFYELRF